MEQALQPQRRSVSAGTWVALGVLTTLQLLLWAPLVRPLYFIYQVDPALSHGPLVVLLALGHLWARRERMRGWSEGGSGGLAVIIVSGLLHVGSVWADFAFLKPLTLVGLLWGVLWFLGGVEKAKASLGPLGFLIFAIPWPTTLVAQLAFPLQITSSSYAAMLTGLLGVPVIRNGVHLFVVPDTSKPAVYSILVAKQCSGLTSMLVLLTLGYLIAYHTPLRLWLRALMIAVVVPLAILTNSLRLTFILLTGAAHGSAAAKWVHDNEAPVLIFFCSLALVAIRQLLLARFGEAEAVEADPSNQPAPLADNQDDEPIPALVS